ncbi:MAG: hydrogenase iron-sulfur subunit [Desulfobacca sp.]|uniref:hydrogenase iron-sulfur subunit n=1 Tax=Desulfobacca sp. TaxID=2067990 RepID=UPI004049DA46
MNETPFKPKILALICTYCTYTAADMAGSARMQYPATVRIVKYLCTGRIDILHILKGFEAGADGVMVSGCEAGSCHFLEGNLRARERVEYAKHLLDECGIGSQRLEMFEVAASDAPKWVEVVKSFTERIQKLGPSPLNPLFRPAAEIWAKQQPMEQQELAVQP